MSGLEPLVLIPIGLAVAQLIQPFLHGLRRIKDKIKGHEVQLERQMITHQTRVLKPTGNAQRGGKVTTRISVRENRELINFAGNAQRGLEASTRYFVEEMHFSHREALRIAESSRQQIVWFACVTICLAYALGQAQAENRYIKRTQIFLDERGMELQNLEGRSWLVALAMWPLRFCWTILTALVGVIRTGLTTLGGAIEAVLIALGAVIRTASTTFGRVVRMSVGGIAGAVSWLCEAVSHAILWIFALPFHMTKLFRRSSGIAAPAQANITAPTFPLDSSPESASLSTLSTSGQTPSPAAIWLASTIHQLLSTATFLLNYPANFVCDFLTAFFEIMGIHRFFIIVPLGLFGTALLGYLTLYLSKQILTGEGCDHTHSPIKKMVSVFLCTLCWAATWRFFAALGTSESVIGLLGAALIILAFTEGRVQKCSYVIC